MSQNVYNFTFDDSVSAVDVQSTFMLALIAVESMHGSVAVRMECRFNCYQKMRQYHVHTDSPIGNDLARIFAGFAMRAYGYGAVQVQRGYAQPDPVKKQISRREFVQ